MAREPARSTVLINDQHVRATRWDFEPGAETGWHHHKMDYVVVPMTDCAFLVEDAARAHRIDVGAGAAYRSDAGAEHNVVNGGEQPMSFIEIELKP